MPDKKDNSKITYAASGVDVRAGEESVERIKRLAASTFNEKVLTGLGAFGAYFKPDLKPFEKPVLVSSTDSVGTKLKLAFMTGNHRTVGADLVNHCINDILTGGATPLFFLDYIALPHLKPELVAEIVSGLSAACREAGVALIGGETAELPDFYNPDEYDLVGFVVGLVDQDKIIDGSKIRSGDICLGLPSNGLHTNGYTLARKAAFEIAGHKPDDRIEQLQMTIAEALMKIHICYAPIVRPLLEKYDIHGMAHITGGGIPGNLKRILPAGLDAAVDKSSWPVPPIFEYLKQAGGIDPVDIYSAFNMGIGYILVVPEDQSETVVAGIEQVGEKVYRIGCIIEGDGAVRLAD